MSDINSYTASFENKRGTKIFCKYWEPQEKPKALVLVAHGYAEHCLPYDTFARLVASKNYLVFAHDHIGHGQSGGSRVHVDTFEQYIEDALQHVDIIKKKYPGLPIFICGHSMGGAISILTALRRPNEFKGVVLIGPAVSICPDLMSPFKIRVARMLRWLVPHMPVTSLDYTTVTRCPKNLKIIQEDPLRRHGFCKVGFAACMLDALQEIQEKKTSIAYPFFIVQGEDDKICEAKSAQDLYESAVSKDKKLKMFPKAYHSLFLEPDGIAEESMRDIVDWLEERS